MSPIDYDKYNQDRADLDAKYNIFPGDYPKVDRTTGGKVRLVLGWVVGLSMFGGIITGIVVSDNKEEQQQIDKFTVVCDKLEGETVESNHKKFECIKDEQIVYSANL